MSWSGEFLELTCPWVKNFPIHCALWPYSALCDSPLSPFLHRPLQWALRGCPFWGAVALSWPGIWSHTSGQSQASLDPELSSLLISLVPGSPKYHKPCSKSFSSRKSQIWFISLHPWANLIGCNNKLSATISFDRKASSQSYLCPRAGLAGSFSFNISFIFIYYCLGPQNSRLFPSVEALNSLSFFLLPSPLSSLKAGKKSGSFLNHLLRAAGSVGEWSALQGMAGHSVNVLLWSIMGLKDGS